ncbi:hypothetical protein [Bacillus toyonensis]|uniref:hypothetical protein n=1 Tax=Bacillus toyonensis TaxID=155322 RepID=UPI0015713C6C|nr:hypothetical protein [Bacillus toyonensis]NSL68456.1 hypothetical protein [Bacillus toyonensis]
MRNKEKKYCSYIVVWFVVGFVVFIAMSLLVLIFTNTEAKDVYTVFFSIVGSLVGGLLTLLGVRQTIQAQREQEALKLIPQKLVSIHKLEKASNKFEKDFLEKYRDSIEMPLGTIRMNEMQVMSEQTSKSEEVDLTEIEISWEALNDLDKVQTNIVTLREWIVDKEYEFIELASEIDTDVYKRVKLLFKTIDGRLEDILGSRKWFRYIPSNPFGNRKFDYLKRREGEVDSIRLDSLYWDIHSFGMNVWDSDIPKFTEDIIEQLNKYEEKEII